MFIAERPKVTRIVTRNTAADKRLRLFSRARQFGVFAGALALLLLALAPLGWRAGIWHYRISFSLIALAGLLAIVGAIGAGVGLAFGRATLRWRNAILPSLAVLLGLGVLIAIWQIRQHGAAPIHDITTDLDNPPAFVTALPARRAEQAAADAYAGIELAYPDIQPTLLAVTPGRAFALALATAKAMPGWTITASDPQAGRIEASQASFWFGFVDDIVIRVGAAGAGSRIDMRSLSRQGRGDLGVNARRIRAYMAALKQAAG
jgi:uncharacterized protein (DUF1499 family)